MLPALGVYSCDAKAPFGGMDISSDGTYGASAHLDYGMITLLVTDGVRGLQICIEKDSLPSLCLYQCFSLSLELRCYNICLNSKFLSVYIITKKEMQLVGLTSLLLASKYEDFWHPKVKDLISISADSYTRNEMLQWFKLMFRLNVPTPYVFMLRFLKAAQSDMKLERLAFYLIELSLVEYEALKFKPSFLCASAIYVARCTLQIAPAWTTLLSRHAHYEESELSCAFNLLGARNCV
uniref:B-like cyclin n=1 Tax=Nelumbo nucifera TaxID=4432 RepID=A0A822Z0J1_NELNU|nr:TPA_asm: hypothetical protein HUJ06_009133 [Nelumbo nucifera]